MHKLLLIASAFIREIMVSLQKRNNMRLKTIKYLLLLVSLMMSLQASADAEVTTSIKLQVSKDSTTINRAPLKPLSPTVSYVEIVYNGVDKTYQDEYPRINPKGYDVYEIKWFETEYDILSKLNITRETFEEHFNEDPVRDAYQDFQQYEKDASGNWVARTPDRYMGIITNEHILTDNPDNQNSTLAWTLTDADVLGLYSEWDKQTEKTFELMTAVKYEDIHGPNAHYKDVYVVFTTKITFKPYNLNVKVDWTQNKIAKYWYVKNTAEMGTDEIHTSVPSVGDELRNDADSLTNLFSNEFYNNEIVNGTIVTGDAGFVYNDFKYRLFFDAANNGKIFKGASGATYTLKVSDNGRELLTTTNQSIAKLVLPEKFADKTGDPEEANYTMIEYQHSNAAHDLLNYASHKEFKDKNEAVLNNYLNVIIALVVQNGESKSIKVEDGQFNVRFLRPIDVTSKNSVIKLASSSGKPIIYLSGLLDYKDWRNEWMGVNKLTGNPKNYFDYYGIKGIKVPGLTDGDPLSDNHNVKCDLNNQGMEALYLISSTLDFIFHEDASIGNYLEYNNLNPTTQDFVIELPVEVEYIWGKIVTKALFDVVFEESYSLSIQSSSGGSIGYNGSTITNSTQMFTVNEGTSATITISPNSGYRLSRLTVNGMNVTSSVSNNQYTISNITANTTVIAVFEQIPATTYSLSIQSGAGGSVFYDGTTITNKTQSFTIAEGSSVTIEMAPNSGYKLASLVVNGTDVTSGVRDNQYTISNITTNTTVVVTFKAIPQTISLDGINYEVRSATDYTLNVGKGNYSGHVVIPATVSYDGDTWTVAGVVDGAFNLSAITAITWNPNTAIGNEAFGAQTNPNLLLYVKSEAYAPSNVQNVIANGRAKKIVLTDAASGNDFNCPEAFTAEEISYTHRYGMTTGIGECRGWETIALPFTVQKVMHQTKGQLVTFKQWDQNTSAKPYWLYKLTYTGFVEADFIEANTPYVISMPNHEKYFVDYILAGNVTFSAENATVKTSENMTMPTCNDKTFRPCFAKTAQSGVYAINAVNSWVTNTGGYKEGSVFVEGLRPVLPFEAYMTTNAANAKGIIPIFETQPTAIREIPMQGVKGVRIYYLSGELIMFDETISIEEALKRLKRGIYFVNGKKMVVNK